MDFALIMAKYISKILICLIILLLSVQVFGQTNKVIEKKLYKHYKKTRTNYYPNEINYETISIENDMFTAELIYYLQTKPATIDYNFNKLTEQDLKINASADSNLRIYSWSINWGGNDPVVYNIFQFRYKDKHGVWADKDNDYSGGYVIDIFQAKLGDDQYYFPYLRSSQSNSPRVEEVTNLAVTSDGTYKDNGLFLTDSSRLKGSLVIAYLPSSDIDSSANKIKFEANTNTFKVPYIDLRTLKLSSKSVKYKFNGEFFEKTKRK